MKDAFSLPDIPGYIDIKEAASMLNVAESSAYRYVQSGRLPAFQAGGSIMVDVEAVKRFKRRNTGRPRKKEALWRISPDTMLPSVMYIRVRMKDNQQEALKAKLGEIKKLELHSFPGTIVRYISLDKAATIVTIQLVWKDNESIEENTRQEQLTAFKHELVDLLDWNTAEYEEGVVLMHT